MWALDAAIRMLAIPEGSRTIEIGTSAIYDSEVPGYLLATEWNLLGYAGKTDGLFDYAIGEPNVGMTLERDGVPLVNAGYGGRVLSHVAAFEMAFRSVRNGGYVAMAIDPHVLRGEDMKPVMKWVAGRAIQVAEVWVEGIALHVWKRMDRIPWKVQMGSCQEAAPFVGDEIKDWRKSSHYQGYASNDLMGVEGVYGEAVRIGMNPRDPLTLEPDPEPVRKSFKSREGGLPLTSHDVVSVKLGSKRVVLKPNGIHAALKLAEAETASTVVVDWQNRKHVSRWKEMSSLAAIYTKGGDPEEIALVKSIRSLGIKAEIDPQLANWLPRKHRWWLRQTAPFEQWVQRREDGPWEEIPVGGSGIRTAEAELYRERMALWGRLSFYYPMLNTFWEHQIDDIIRASLKQSVLFAKQQGLGKTRSGYAWALLTQARRVLFVVPSHLLGEWEEEAETLGLDVHVIEHQKDAARNALGHLNLISYDTLGAPFSREDRARAEAARILKEAEKPYPRHRTYADVLSRRFGAIVYDEAHYMSNRRTLRAQGSKKLHAKHKLSLTGTPIKNTVKNLWSVLDVLYGAGYGSQKGHPLFPYTEKEFNDTFATAEWVTKEYEEVGGSRSLQQRATIKNLEEFRRIMATKMIRRVQKEPEVARDVVMPKYDLIEHAIDPDHDHLTHYKSHLEAFAEWFRAAIEKENQGGAKLENAALLSMLSNLMFASTIPQHRKVNTKANPWPGGLTEKQKRFVEVCKHEIACGNRVFAASIRPDFAAQAVKWLEAEGIKAIEFTGKIDRKERIALKKLMREDPSIQVMIGSYAVVSTGLNLWFLQACILVDYPWTFSEMEQLWFRLLRTQQTVTPRIHLMFNRGMMDSYMKQHCNDKQNASEEGIDHREDGERIDKWISYKDFTIRMLMDKGLW